MSHRDPQDLTDLERELRLALDERARRITPTDSWTEHTMTTPQHRSLGRSTVVLLAAAAVLAVVGGLWILRPQGSLGGAAPANHGSPTVLTSPSPTPSTSPSVSPSSSTPIQSETSSGVALPVYYIAQEALGWPESGLGLRRDWISPLREGATTEQRVVDALTVAMARSIATEGGANPWADVSLTDVRVGTDRIELTLDRGPSTPLADQVAELAVQQLVWTAQAAVGQGNVRVLITRADGQRSLWGVNIGDDFVRPPADQSYGIVADIWITTPFTSAQGTFDVPTGQPLVVKGEACVFEANVQWEVTDQAGKVVERGTTTASTGAPVRGTFEFTVKGLAPGTYTVKASSMSMEDGTTEVANDKLRLTVR